MIASYIEEPLLEFGKGKSVCPKTGIKHYTPYDITHEDRPEKIKLGLIGIGESIEKIQNWLERCRTYIPAKDSKQPKLFLDFLGFNEDVAFKSKIVYPDGYVRKILNTSFNETLKIEQLSDRISELISLFLEEIEFLSKNKKPDVILCILPEKSIGAIWEIGQKLRKPKKDSTKEEKVDDVKDRKQQLIEQNFRRELKAKAMQYNIPIQIVRDRLANPKRDMQDEATIAWNFFSALYYKAGGIPWALERDVQSVSCYAGISFYKSRDRTVTETSVAQIFNELGKGVILRGEPIKIDKNSRTTHLSQEQAYKLLSQALDEYRKAIKTMPQRLVLHKTSNFNQEEILGFRLAAEKSNIHMLDLVTIQEGTSLRLYRDANYPPPRGTMVSFDEQNHLLYTRGYVPYYETYTGSYIPHPLLIRTFQAEESPKLICEEIIKLTKLNWNNTQFDGKYPISIGCARNVGEILKYVEQDTIPQLKYSFYM